MRWCMAAPASKQATDAGCRLYLVTPPRIELGPFADALKAALDLGDEPDTNPNFRSTPDVITFLTDGSRAQSNAELVDDIVRAAERVGRKVVGPHRAREIMGLGPQA